MRRRSAVRNRLEYAAVVCALATLEYAPRGVAEGLARLYSRLLDLAIPRLRRVARRNLTLAFPQMDEAGREGIIDGVFRSIARIFLSFARFPRIRRDTVDQWIRCEGMEHFTAARARGRGVLFATAHLGNWELSAFAHALIAGPMHVVVRPLDNPLLDALVRRRRSLSGNRVIAKRDFARTIFKALTLNEAVGLLIDQNAAVEEGEFVNFFGVPASAGTGFARIAARSGATVIPGFALWEETEGRYVLRFYPPVELSGDAVRDTQALQSQLETVIRQYPDQWLWIHRRWKTRPPGEAPLYATTREAPHAL